MYEIVERIRGANVLPALIYQHKFSPGVEGGGGRLNKVSVYREAARQVQTFKKAPIKWPWCVIVDHSAPAHFHPNYHQLSSAIMRAVKREKLSSTIITILNMFIANDS